MRKSLWFLAIPVVAASLSLTQCGSSGPAGAKSKTDLKSLTTGTPTATGTLTSTSQIDAAVEGLLNGGVSGSIGKAFGGGKLNPRVDRALSAAQGLWKTHAAAAADPSTCVVAASDGKSFSYDYACLGIGTGSFSIACDGDFSTGTDLFCTITFDHVTVTDGSYTADGTIWFYSNGTETCVSANGTFDGETIDGTFIACANSTTFEPTLLVVEDAAGDVFIIDNIACTPNFDSPTSCTFDVTDASATKNCTTTPTVGATGKWDVTCTGVSS